MRILSKYKKPHYKFIPLLATFVIAFGSTQATIAEDKAGNDSERVSTSTFRAPGEKESTVKTMRKQMNEATKAEGQVQEKSQLAQQKLDGHVWVDYATVNINTDIDGDGYYTRISLDLDVDSDYFQIDVYARLFLSLEQGPWIEYAVTDDFVVTSVGGDSFYIDTDLVEGFPPGYYDLKIEVYDAVDDYLVATYGPPESSELTLLPLEDEFADSASFVNEPAGSATTSNSGGGGSTSGLTLLALLILTAVQLRKRRKSLHRCRVNSTE